MSISRGAYYSLVSNNGNSADGVMLTVLMVITMTDLELLVLPPPECRDCRHVLSYLPIRDIFKHNIRYS